MGAIARVFSLLLQPGLLLGLLLHLLLFHAGGRDHVCHGGQLAVADEVAGAVLDDAHVGIFGHYAR